MRYVNPQVEYWQQKDGKNADHIAQCARVCYASDKTTDSEKMTHRLIASGHLSMFRHESRYYIVSDIKQLKTDWLIHFLQNQPYVGCHVLNKRSAWISTNGQFVREHNALFEGELKRYEVEPSVFCAKARKTKVKPIMMLVRHTLCVTTSIATTRELNRTSPNSIAEQSTRYVNFGKKYGGIDICRSWFQLAVHKDKMNHSWWRTLPIRISWHVSDWAYRLSLRCGVKPQDARACLPLETASRAVYTYNAFEWKHILDLRLRQLTGPAAPDAVIIADKIQQQILWQFHLRGMNITI